MNKICIKCKEEKEEGQFPFQFYIRQDGLRARRPECKVCYNRRRDERRKKNGEPEARKKSQRTRHSNSYHTNEEIRERMQLRSRTAWLKKNYGITQNDYNNMLKEQEYKCKICGKLAEECIRGILDIDHCHTTGKIRGLLCTDCNNLLGRAKDKIPVLKAAAEYLEEFITKIIDEMEDK